MAGMRIWTPSKPTGPVRRYQVRQAIGMIAYALIVVGVAWAFRALHPEGPLKYLLAALPALPLLGIILSIAVYLTEETDEFRRMTTVMVLLGGLGLTLAVTTVWGFLESFAGLAHLPLWSVFVIFGLSMLVSGPLVWWRYR